MRILLAALFMLALLTACKTPRLAERVPGRWQIEHYDEYSARTDRSSGHDFDECGYLSFRNGRVDRQLSAGRAHGSLSPLSGARYDYNLADSTFVIRDAAGNTLERWLMTKDLIDYMEWVRVSDDRDSVFTMYLRK